MRAPAYLSLVVFERVSTELARVLRDAGCSFVAADGQYHFANSEQPPGASTEAARFAAALLDDPGRASSASTIDLGAGRSPGTVAVLRNPVELLHWLARQPAAVDFHPTLNAYLGSSDPDDILPYLPFHPAPGEGGAGASAVVAVRVRGAATDRRAAAAGSFRIAGLELRVPGEAPGP